MSIGRLKALMAELTAHAFSLLLIGGGSVFIIWTHGTRLA
jgi:hypothetical protein